MKRILSYVLILWMILSISVNLVSCSHEHSYSAGWSSDSDNHWHGCEVKNCDECTDKAAHTFGENTSQIHGTRKLKCTVCEYEKTEEYETRLTDEQLAAVCDLGDKYTITVTETADNGDGSETYKIIRNGDILSHGVYIYHQGTSGVYQYLPSYSSSDDIGLQFDGYFKRSLKYHTMEECEMKVLEDTHIFEEKTGSYNEKSKLYESGRCTYGYEDGRLTYISFDTYGVWGYARRVLRISYDAEELTLPALLGTQQVSEADWNSVLTVGPSLQSYYINKKVFDGTKVARIELINFSDGKMEYEVRNENDYITLIEYYSKLENQPYYSYKKQNGTGLFVRSEITEAVYNENTDLGFDGIFAYSAFTYNESSRSYTAKDIMLGNILLTNVEIQFDNGVLASVSYKYIENGTEYTVNCLYNFYYSRVDLP